MKRLPRTFFERPTLEVARDLLGKWFVFGEKKGVITETEAYLGDDPASHGARGKTPRNFAMFGEAGHAYVYQIYGVYFCFNITTERENFPAAVLIRGIKVSGGLHLNGPGKLCRFFGITRAHNNLDLCTEPDFFIVDSELQPKFKTTPRVGITKAIEKPWRFVETEKTLDFFENCIHE